MVSKTVINCNGGIVNMAILLAALVKSELHWEMHRAQLYALDLLAYMKDTCVEVTPDKDKLKIEVAVPATLTHTLFGIDIKVNDEYPRTLIRLMWGDREISRIENLAVPSAMSYNGPDYDGDLKRESEKFQRLTY